MLCDVSKNTNIMLVQTQAHLFLAEQRSVFQDENIRNCAVLPYGHNFIHKILSFSDDTLRGGYSLNRVLTEPLELIIIPLVGGIEYQDNHNCKEAVFIEAGSSFKISLQSGTQYQISNPYTESDLVNFLHIWRTNTSANFSSEIVLFNWVEKNILIPILNDKTCFMGKYGGREEGLLKCDDSSAFIWIVEGVFEVQNRLLHAKDALALWNLEDIDFEALSNDAIIIIFKF